jgi:plasmid stabilization system protein ParE
MAAQKLAAIEQWYRQPGAGRAAARRVQTILAAIDRLEYFPDIGPDGDIPETRELTAQDHRMVYEVITTNGTRQTEGDIVVLNVLGPGEP